MRLTMTRLVLPTFILVGLAAWSACTLPSPSNDEARPAVDQPFQAESEERFQAYNAEHQQRLPLALAPEISDVQHRTIHHDPGYFCAHPRWGVYKEFGSGEMIVAFKMAPSEYKRPADVKHGGTRREGYEQKAVILLKRTTDSGQTWPAENDLILYDETLSDDEKRAFLYQKSATREQYDMFSSDSVFWFTHTYLRDEKRMVLFALRPVDRGRTWEKVPTVIEPPPGKS